jgi:hypothetical protein
MSEILFGYSPIGKIDVIALHEPTAPGYQYSVYVRKGRNQESTINYTKFNENTPFMGCVVDMVLQSSDFISIGLVYGYKIQSGKRL